MTAPFRLVATDLDGTLLRSDLTVSPRSRRALAAAGTRGVRHLVVTGRQVAACRRLLAGLGYHGLLVCSQGAQLYDLTLDRPVWSATLDRSVARDVAARVGAEAGPISVGVATAGAHGRILVSRGFYSKPGADCEPVEPARLWAEPIEKMFLRHRMLSAHDLTQLVSRLYGDAVTATYSHHDVVEILPAGVTKGHGLTLAADLLGFSPSGTVAFGDMPNDISMLQWAGHGVAMRNGDERLLAVADEIAPGNDDDGVAVVLERMYASRPRRRGAK
ncbi:HAD family hydrolase [Nonomuraea sp. NPDC050153]|uniref:HAD family hydrolase n=1 Tax=Nonomuraea sp. NPDC050153 TaxID=3364359 RepID=UPI0037A1E25A